MTTLTIEIEDTAARLAIEKARLANLSVDEWIARRIAGRSRVHSKGLSDPLGYPPGWFERTGGALAAVEDFREPADAPPAAVPPLEL
jgi:hypothetical protein